MSYLYDECEEVRQALMESAKILIKETDSHKKPSLLIIANNTFAGHAYVRNKVKACEKLGIDVNVVEVSYDGLSYPSSFLENVETIIKSNEDATGIIIQQPLTNFPHLNTTCINLIPIHQDVDGLRRESWEKCLPATALGIMTYLSYNFELREPKNVTLIGRSELVGSPLAYELMKMRNVTLTCCNSTTKDLKLHTKNADIVIVAVGKAKFIKAGMIKEGALVIDVGINKDEETGKLCGDVDPEVAKIARVTPVPKGVGLLTVASLMFNVADAWASKN